MATSSYDHASATVLIFGVGSLVFVTIAFCMTFLGYALYCRVSRKAINWKAWWKPTAVLVMAFGITLTLAFSLHIIVPALCFLAAGLFGYLFTDNREPVVDSIEEPSDAPGIPELGLRVDGPYSGNDPTDPLCMTYWEK